MKNAVILSIISLLVTAQLILAADTIYVGPARTHTTIQAGINAAADGDTVIVDPGTYTGPGNRDIQLTGKSITVRSDTGPQNCIIDCNGTQTEPHRGFNFSDNQDANAVIDGFTVINGSANYGSAGIDCRDNQNSALTISNCSIRNNTTYGRGSDGGGISIMDGIYSIYNCTISDNWADNMSYGGGGINIRYSNSDISNCTVSGNSAGQGGAIISISSNTNIKNCTITGNFAHNGGGINIRYSNSDISNCVIRGNSADYYGGGICFEGSNPNMKNCTISGNSAGNGGGGIYCEHSTPDIKNCTISGNSAIEDGDGMYIYKSDPILTNCILWGDSPSQIYNNTSTPVINYCCIRDWSGGGTGNFSDDPLLAPDGFHLLPGSPCVNAGDPSGDYTGQTDIDGQPRVMAGRVDTGADEIALTFVALEIAGPAQVKSYSQNQYNATAHCDGGDTYDATTFVLWWVEPQTFAGIDQDGVLTTGPIDTPQDITVYAQYTENDITLEAELTVQLLPPRILHVPAEYDTIQAAIDSAEDGEIVLVADGIYTGDGNRDLDFKNKSITVKSQNGPENCTIDCNGTQTELHRGFNFSNNQDVNSTIDGFTIINGYTQYGSAGIDCRQNQNSTLTISNCNIRNNTAVSFEYGSSPYGGGISILYGIYFINNCTISDNLAVWGGGINCYYSNLTISNCTISNNSAKTGGGGISCDNSNLNIKNCTFRGNTVQGVGGAINFYNSNPTLTNCTFSGNSARAGGGLQNQGFSSPTVTNCIFTGNSAEHGGGMLNDESNPTLTNCTFSGNSARYHGGGMSNFFVSSPTLTNCILWGNTARDGPQIYDDVGSTVTVSYSGVQGGWPGQGNINVGRCFVNPGFWNGELWIEGDYHLLGDSPCIDAGDNNSVPADMTDLDGDGDMNEPIPWDLDCNSRIADGNNDGNSVVDMGAYEFIPPIEVPMKFTPQALNLSSGGQLVKAHFVLPEGFTVEDVNANTPAVIAHFGVESYNLSVLLNDEGLVRVEATFNRSDLCSSITSYDDNIEVMVTGWLNTGQQFYGTDIIKVTNRAFDHLAVLVSHWLQADCGQPDWCGGADLNADSVVNFKDFALLDRCCIEVINQ